MRSRQLAGARRRQPKRLYDHLWAKTSREFRYGKLCVHCRLLHRITPAECTDHIYPHGGDKTLFWDERNWQPLCEKCHALKSYRESRGFVVLWKHLPDRFVVTGLPASGKTTWWQEHFTDTPVRYRDLMWTTDPGVYFSTDIGERIRIWDMDIEARKLGLSTEWPRPTCQTHILLEERRKFIENPGVDPWVYVTTWIKDGYQAAARHHAQLVECHVSEQLRKQRLLARQLSHPKGLE